MVGRASFVFFFFSPPLTFHHLCARLSRRMRAAATHRRCHFSTHGAMWKDWGKKKNNAMVIQSNRQNNNFDAVLAIQSG